MLEDALLGTRGAIILATVAILAVADVLILKPFKVQGRYEILHAVGNALVTALTFSGMVSTLLEPMQSFDGAQSISGYCVAIGIHAYHVLAFQPLSSADWMHHILMIGLVGPIVFQFGTGNILDFCTFFLSGLPGGMSYVLLALRKNSKLDRMDEKRMNAAINTWLRTPFTVIGGYIIFTLVWKKRHALTTAEIFLSLLIAGLTTWNGLFYGRRVVENYGSSRMPATKGTRLPDPHVS